MKLWRRQFLQLATGAAVLPVVSRMARALDYPTRPVRIIVGYAAGGPTDISARLLTQFLSQRLGKQFVVENRPGAAGNIATEAVVNAPPDGYTLLGAPSSTAINTALYQNLRFVFDRDTVPVAGVLSASNVMVVTPSFPAQTVPEFVTHAKANPGRINFCSGGSGTSQHVSAELFKMMTGIDMLHVPYRGSAPALTDLIAGQVQVMFDSVSSVVGYIRSGQLRGVAVTAPTRLEALPELPTIAEFVPGFEVRGWFGVCAPKNTPPEITAFLNNEINAVITEPAMRARLADLGLVPMPGSSADFGKFIVSDTEKWAKVIKFTGIKAD